MLENPGELNFDQDVLEIISHHDPHAMPAPSVVRSLVPPSPQCESLLNKVLYDPASQEQRLLASLAPQITNAELRQPYVYSGMIDVVLSRLNKRLEALDSPGDRKKIQGAVNTLEQFRSLLGTFRQYQHALHRG